MNKDNHTSYLARRVISQINDSYADSAPDLSETSKSLDEALTSLRPFEPPEADIRDINSYLKKRQASDLACKAAWALYKDFVINQQKN